MSNSTALEACERWRLRGNEAYKQGNLSRAEECYTKGVKSVPCNDISGCLCLEPLVLCYSNRAAVRMTCKRFRDALGDCLVAATLDPNFLKVRLRAANCHLMLGEVEDAVQYFSKFRESGGYVCLDRKVALEAADGLHKAKKVANCIHQCAELLKQRTSDAATNALAIIDDVLSISSYSEKLLEMKGKALLMLQKYEEVIQLCERTLGCAEKNFPMVGAGNNLPKGNGSQYNKHPSVRLWRWHLMSRSHFQLGRLEVALDLIKKHEQLRCTEEKYQSNILGSSMLFAATIRKLLHYEKAGNEALHAGRHREAIDYYTAAISSSTESRLFTAICFRKRAAARQALGQISDAIADCNLAIALDGNYLKAMYQRATLHETVRDYEQATSDLKRFFSILEKQLQEKVQVSGTPDGPTGSNVDERARQSGTPDGITGSNMAAIRRASRLLTSVEEKAEQETFLDLYLILGIKASDTASEIKRAYREAALRHHPDKVATKFLAETGENRQLWNEIADEICKNADRLYMMIAEAFGVLSEPTKRYVYDLKEELRNAQENSNGGRASV